MKAKTLKPGNKHPLRLYQRPFEVCLWPAFLIALIAYISWWFWVDLPLPEIGRIFVLLVIPPAWLVYLVSLVAPSFCYVQCRPSYVVIRALFFRLAISYSRIGNIVPANFATKYPLQRQGWIENMLLEPLFHEQHSGQLTVVAVNLKQYPLPYPLLRLMFSKYMFFPPRDGLGFLFIVGNWLLLSHELEDYRDAWRARRMTRKTTVGSTVASQVLKKGERKR